MRYRKERKNLERFKNNRIIKVIMTRVEKLDKDKMATIELMLEKMIMKTLMEYKDERNS